MPWSSFKPPWISAGERGPREENRGALLRRTAEGGCPHVPHGRVPHGRGLRLCFSLLVAAGFATAVFLPGAPETKLLAVYSPTANFSLPVTERNGGDYVGLLEILEPLGAVTARADGRSWKLRYNNLDGEFADGKTRVRVQGQSFDLPGSFLLDNGRGLVPLGSLPTLMQRFLGTPVNFHETSRRLFIGNVAVHFTAQVNRAIPQGLTAPGSGTSTSPTAPTLVMNFSSPVNPMIATEPGRLRMVFTHEPLVPPGSQTLTFDSPAIPSATFQESNGAAEIVVAGPAPLFASFSNDGRTITITPAPQVVARASQGPAQAPAAASVTPAPQVQPGAPAAVNNSTAPLSSPSASSGQYFAVVDASHGGDERGAALSDQLAEKDVTLAFARRLRQELQAHGLTTLLLRDGDVTLNLDQRASLTNGARPAIYICLHAGLQGSGVRLYTALLPSGGENRGPFLDWNTAQSGFRAVSQTAELSLAAEFGKRQLVARSLAAPLRPLNNVAAAAVAIEIAPPGGKISDLDSPAYWQVVAESVTAGIEAVRDKLGAAQGVAP
jgi:N-acetylmuramoyl-L-alanine amidase